MQLEVNEDEMYNKPNTKREEKIKVQNETRKKWENKKKKKDFFIQNRLNMSFDMIFVAFLITEKIK